MQVQDLEERNLTLGLQLEALTGEPPNDSVPSTPPDLSLPSQVQTHNHPLSPTHQHPEL
jgi:hypothetical protein